MKRQLIFSAPLDAWLVREAARLGISVSELVRRVLDEKRGAEPKESR